MAFGSEGEDQKDEKEQWESGFSTLTEEETEIIWIT